MVHPVYDNNVLLLLANRITVLAKREVSLVQLLFRLHRRQMHERCSIPGNIPGQVGRGSEQPCPVEDVPAYGRGVEPGDL